MECLLAFFAVLFILTASLGAFGIRSSTSRRRRSYRQLGRQFAGRYQSGGIFRRPRLHVPYGTTRVMVREASCRRPFDGRGTLIQVAWPDARMTCELVPKKFSERPTRFSGLSQLSADDDFFDNQFLLRAKDGDEVKRLLSDGVRWQILRLLELSGDSGLSVWIHRGYLNLQMPILLRQYEALEQYLQGSLDLYDQMMLTRAVGIEFPGREPATNAARRCLQSLRRSS